MDEAVGLDPFDGLEDEAGDVRPNVDPGAIGRGLDDVAFVFLVARILPIGHDLDAVADLEGLGAVGVPTSLAACPSHQSVVSP